MLIKLCEICGSKQATELHHKFSQTKQNKKLYGTLIHSPSNLQAVCHNCHQNRAHHWSEMDFCAAIGIEPRSKTAKFKREFACV